MTVEEFNALSPAQREMWLKITEILKLVKEIHQVIEADQEEHAWIG
jgi:hypothetical protein